MPDDSITPVITSLISHGPIGVLCIGLGYALRAMWKRNEELGVKYDNVQKARLDDRDVVTKALVEASVVQKEMLEYLNSRRR